MNRCDFCNDSVRENCEYKNTVISFHRQWCSIAEKSMKRAIEKLRLLEAVESTEEQIRKGVVKAFAKTLISLLWEEEKGESIQIKDLHKVIKDVAQAQYSVEVDDEKDT